MNRNMKINKKHKGAYSELRAILWFLKNGYEVYRNVSSHGICDMIVTKDNELIKVDVKTAQKSPHSGELYCSARNEQQKKQDVQILMVYLDDDVIKWQERQDIFYQETRKCKNCDKDIRIDKKVRRNKVYCGSICRAQYGYKLKKESTK